MAQNNNELISEISTDSQVYVEVGRAGKTSFLHLLPSKVPMF